MTPTRALAKGVAGLVFAAWILNGCSESVSGGLTNETNETEETSQMNEGVDMPRSPWKIGNPLSEAIEDLSIRLGVSADQIELIEQREVTWRDASVGCPQPGMKYAQVLVNGTLIRLRVDEQVYQYHAGGRRSVFYCANPQDPLPPEAEGFGPT